MDISTATATATATAVSSATNNNNTNINTTTNSTNTTTNSGQLMVGIVPDDIHLQSHHQQKSQQIIFNSVSQSFANNFDSFNNSMLANNLTNTSFPSKVYHETSNIFESPKNLDHFREQHLLNQCQRTLFDDEVREVLMQLVIRVSGQICQQDSSQNKQLPTQDHNGQVEPVNPSAETNTKELNTTEQASTQEDLPKNDTESHFSSSPDDATGDLVIDSVQANDQPDESPEQPAPASDQPDQIESPMDHFDNTATSAAKSDQKETSEVALDSLRLSPDTMQQESDHDDSREEKTKDIVTLRNLEITPPPNLEEDAAKNEAITNEINEARPEKRRRTESPEPAKLDDSTESGGRSKRQRKQTKLFQAGDVRLDYDLDGDDSLIQPQPTKARTSRPSLRNRKKSTNSSSTPEINPPIAQAKVDTDQQVVKLYEKNDYLAIRNEDNSFYLCQLAEDVDITRTIIKVRWLDVKEGEKLYFLTSDYDRIPQASIIMPVTFPDRPKHDRKARQYFELEDEVRENIMERLKRSLNITAESKSTQESSTDGQ